MKCTNCGEDTAEDEIYYCPKCKSHFCAGCIIDTGYIDACPHCNKFVELDSL